ncbi:alpha/beta hydrolase [Hyphomicrobium sp.]|uniref:alpha/beta fold hydrolase n=1 Tax=Hyphomicrobium sp. TaxID=82 RepID=UPI0025B94D91|nr:alpha/beta hydrolase [Hyphomicrobium sp.]MCC7252591.1 alpha/beta hydrolase [Hyphomicrobium sp.]
MATHGDERVRERRRRQRAAVIGAAMAGAMLIGLSERAAPAPEPLAAEAPGNRITLALPDSPPVALYYEEYGSGPPLLLLHGLGESTFTWHEILPALAARHRVIALDLKGFGRSDKPDDDAYSADDQAALVARFILERDLRNVVVIGHSFGGTVALRTALAKGIAGTGRIRRIAVIGAPALPRATARYLDLVMAPLIPDAVATVLPADAAARFLLREAMGGRVPSEHTVEGYAAPYRERGAIRAFFATARSIINEHDADAVAARYKGVKQPVLLVWCRKDPIVPLRAGRQLAAALPRARLAVIEGCHHLPQHERPKQLLKTLGPFLRN